MEAPKMRDQMFGQALLPRQALVSLAPLDIRERSYACTECRVTAHIIAGSARCTNTYGIQSLVLFDRRCGFISLLMFTNTCVDFFMTIRADSFRLDG